MSNFQIVHYHSSSLPSMVTEKREATTSECVEWCIQHARMQNRFRFIGKPFHLWAFCICRLHFIFIKMLCYSSCSQCEIPCDRWKPNKSTRANTNRRQRSEKEITAKHSCEFIIEIKFYVQIFAKYFIPESNDIRMHRQICMWHALDRKNNNNNYHPWCSW